MPTASSTKYCICSENNNLFYEASYQANHREEDKMIHHFGTDIKNAMLGERAAMLLKKGFMQPGKRDRYNVDIKSLKVMPVKLTYEFME